MDLRTKRRPTNLVRMNLVHDGTKWFRKVSRKYFQIGQSLFLFGKGLKVKACHDDVAGKKRFSLASSFSTASSSIQIFLSARDSNTKCYFFLERKRQLGSVVEVEPVSRFSFHVYIGVGYWKYAVAKYLGNNNTPYYLYLVLATIPAKNVVFYSYGSSLGVFTEVKEAGTEIFNKERVVGGTSIRPKTCGSRSEQLK